MGQFMTDGAQYTIDQWETNACGYFGASVPVQVEPPVM